MGLQETFKVAAKTVVDAFGDVGVSTNYESHTSSTYDASAGTNVATYSTTAGVTVIFDSFRIDQIDGQNIKPEDKLALLPAKNISGVTPDVDDRIIESGVVWNVVSVSTDPASALYQLQVRKS